MNEKINAEALENVTGGAIKTVNNDSSKYSNVRSAPGLNSAVIGRVNNGDKVETTGRHQVKDGYDWYEIKMGVAGHSTGFIAGSLIGY